MEDGELIQSVSWQSVCVKVAKWTVTAVLVLLVIIAVVKSIYFYKYWAYMRPYREMVAHGATRKQVISQEGEPMDIVADQYSLAVHTRRDKPFAVLPPLRGGSVLVYPADPYNDGEGYVLYLVFNRKGVLVHATLGL
ncbi:MAG: hypothetical protein ACYC0V_08115 [Armatimonadota bacterium]